MKGNIITHGRIVGGGSEQNGRLTYHCADFVEWADGANVEAVFVGHTHQNHLFYDVDTGNIDDPDDMYEGDHRISPTSVATIYFAPTPPDPAHGICDSPAYIETENGT